MGLNRNVDPIRPGWREWLWAAGGWKMLAIVGPPLILGVALAIVNLTSRPEEEEARLIRFGSYAGEDGNMPLLVVRLGDGTVWQVAAPPTDARACRVGGIARLLRRGQHLALQPGGCLQR